MTSKDELTLLINDKVLLNKKITETQGYILELIKNNNIEISAKEIIDLDNHHALKFLTENFNLYDEDNTYLLKKYFKVGSDNPINIKTISFNEYKYFVENNISINVETIKTNITPELINQNLNFFVNTMLNDKDFNKAIKIKIKSFSKEEFFSLDKSFLKERIDLLVMNKFIFSHDEDFKSYYKEIVFEFIKENNLKYQEFYFNRYVFDIKKEDDRELLNKILNDSENIDKELSTILMELQDLLIIKNPETNKYEFFYNHDLKDKERFSAVFKNFKNEMFQHLPYSIYTGNKDLINTYINMELLENLILSSNNISLSIIDNQWGVKNRVVFLFKIFDLLLMKHNTELINKLSTPILNEINERDIISNYAPNDDSLKQMNEIIKLIIPNYLNDINVLNLISKERHFKLNDYIDNESLIENFDNNKTMNRFILLLKEFNDFYRESNKKEKQKLIQLVKNYGKYFFDDDEYFVKDIENLSYGEKIEMLYKKTVNLNDEKFISNNILLLKDNDLKNLETNMLSALLRVSPELNKRLQDNISLISEEQKHLLVINSKEEDFFIKNYLLKDENLIEVIKNEKVLSYYIENESLEKIFINQIKKIKSNKEIFDFIEINIDKDYNYLYNLMKLIDYDYKLNKISVLLDNNDFKKINTLYSKGYYFNTINAYIKNLSFKDLTDKLNDKSFINIFMHIYLNDEKIKVNKYSNEENIILAKKIKELLPEKSQKTELDFFNIEKNDFLNDYLVENHTEEVLTNLNYAYNKESSYSYVNTPYTNKQIIKLFNLLEKNNQTVFDTKEINPYMETFFTGNFENRKEEYLELLEYYKLRDPKYYTFLCFSGAEICLLDKKANKILDEAKADIINIYMDKKIINKGIGKLLEEHIKCKNKDGFNNFLSLSFISSIINKTYYTNWNPTGPITHDVWNKEESDELISILINHSPLSILSSYKIGVYKSRKNICDLSNFIKGDKSFADWIYPENTMLNSLNLNKEKQSLEIVKDYFNSISLYLYDNNKIEELDYAKYIIGKAKFDSKNLKVEYQKSMAIIDNLEVFLSDNLNVIINANKLNKTLAIQNNSVKRKKI